jgi:hypothetical protein
VTNDSEQYVEDLLAQVAWRFFRAFSLIDRRDALKKEKIEIAHDHHVSELEKALQR